MHYNDHRLNKGPTTGARGGQARTTVPTNTTLKTSATGKVKHLSTQPQDDNRSPTLLPWSMGYWLGTHHLWVGSLLCAQITGSQDVVKSIRLACDELFMLESLINNAAPSALVWELRLGVAPLWSHCVFAKPTASCNWFSARLDVHDRWRARRRSTLQHWANREQVGPQAPPTGVPRQSTPQQRRNHWCARRHSPHH